MIAQSPLNVVLDVESKDVDACADLLAQMKSDPGDNPILPFRQLENLHFGRFVLLPEANKRVGERFGAKLVLATNHDGDAAVHLRDIVRTGADGLARLLAHCVGCPESGGEDALFDYLDGHRRKVQAFYINTVGRTVAQVTFEARLHDAVQAELDSRDWSGRSAEEIREALVGFVRADPELHRALEPAEEPSLLWRLLGWARLAVVVVVLLGAALLLWPLTIAFVVLLRVHEICNLPDNRRPLDAHINQLENDEDHGVQNHLSAVGVMQRGWFRNGLLRAGLFLLQLGSRYIFNRGKLAEIDTIHFARWVIIDNSARLYFFSNFDGSPESYQDDFIERVAFGLNLVFSNGVGWPRTRYLLFGGASDEQSLKSYYRDHQIPTGVWFGADAYAGLTAVNIANNAEIRRGLAQPLTGDALRDWLQRF